jgi:hypothetical protein
MSRGRRSTKPQVSTEHGFSGIGLTDPWETGFGSAGFGFSGFLETYTQTARERGAVSQARQPYASLRSAAQGTAPRHLGSDHCDPTDRVVRSELIPEGDHLTAHAREPAHAG